MPPTPLTTKYDWKFWLLVIVVLLMGVWQTCTWLYLRNDLRGWLDDHGGGDGTSPPKPPPRF